MREKFPRLVSRLWHLPFVLLVGVRSPRDHLFSTRLLRDGIDLEPPSEELFEPFHARFELGHESHENFCSNRFHRDFEIILRQFTRNLVRELSGHPIVLYNARLSVLAQSPFLEIRSVRRLPVGHLDVIKHGNGPIDGMAKNGEHAPLGRGCKEIIRLVHERRHDNVRESRIGESHGLCASNAVRGRDIHIDKGTPIYYGAGTRNTGINNGHLGILIMAVRDTKLRGHDETMTPPHGILDARTTRFGNMPEHGNGGFIVGIPRVLKVSEPDAHVRGGHFVSCPFGNHLRFLLLWRVLSR